MRFPCFKFFLFLLLLAQGSPLQLEVGFPGSKCLNEEVPANTYVIGDYSTNSVPDVEFDIEVVDPNSKVLYRKENGLSGRFSFDSSVSGDHKVCLTNRLVGNAVANPPQGKRRVALNMKTGYAAKNYDELAKKENLKPLEVQLRRMEDTVTEIQKEMEYMRKREASMRDTNESTNARVAWLSVLSICILLGLGVWQIFYLKKFFQAKKLI